MKLTKNLIDTTPCPAKGQLILRDSSVKGFGLRLTPTCKSFVVEGLVNGTRKRVSIGRYGSINVEDARNAAQLILADFAAGVDPVARKEHDKTAGTTLQQCLDQFLATRQLTPHTAQTYRRLIERNLPEWLDRPLTALTKEMCETMHHRLVGPTRCKTEGKSRANRTFEILRLLMRWAVDRYVVDGKPLIVNNPVDRLKQNRQWFRVPPRQGTIPDAKLNQFYLALMGQPKIARDYLMLLLFTGLRRMEAARLKWVDIDFEAKTLTIPAENHKR